MSSSDSWMKSLQLRSPLIIPLGWRFSKLLSTTSLNLGWLRPRRSSLSSPPQPLDLPRDMTTTLSCSRMLASDMMVDRNLGPLQPLESYKSASEMPYIAGHPGEYTSCSEQSMWYGDIGEKSAFWDQ